MRYFIYLTFIVISFLLTDDAVASETTPSDVYKAVAEVRADIELIRENLNKSKSDKADIPVDMVSPREVFVQAETLERKIHQLTYEQTGEIDDLALNVPKGKVKPADVLVVVKSAKRILQKTKNKLNITSQQYVPDYSSKAPGDVFKSIIHANSQLNLLLKDTVIPSDVYQRVEQSINYAFVLRKQFPNPQMPSPKPLVPGKKPSDVYNRLISCLRVLEEIMGLSGVRMLDLASDFEASGKITPGDVYDMASIVFSEITHLYFSMDNRELTPGVFYPGKKAPSDVFQKVMLLEDLLLDISYHVDNKPNWLAGR